MAPYFNTRFIQIQTNIRHRSLRGNGCSGCDDLFIAGFFNNRDSCLTLLNVPAVKEKASRKSCALCQLFCDIIKSCTYDLVPYKAWIETKSSLDKYESGVVELVVQQTVEGGRSDSPTGAGEEFGGTKRFTILLEPGGESFPHSGVPNHLRSIRQNSMPSYLNPGMRWKMVESWITECMNNHEDCRGKVEAELPTRWLDIGVNDHGTIKVATSTKGETGIYACLSHCWGGKTPCTLNRGTKMQFSASIPKAAMPRIFIDAISISRRLGIRRLWIDSLCIEQDSQEDWQHEAGKMGPYYSNCFLCVAATSSPNSSGTLDLVKHPDGTIIRSSGRDAQTGPFSLIAVPSDLLAIDHFIHTRLAESPRVAEIPSADPGVEHARAMACPANTSFLRCGDRL